MTHQALIDPIGENATQEYFMATLQMLTQDRMALGQTMTTQSQAIKTQANREVVALVKLVRGMITSRVKVHFRMNLPKLYGSKVEKDPQGSIDQVYKVISIMVLSLVEKVELATY